MNHLITIPSIASYYPHLPTRYVQEYNLGAQIEVGVAYNPLDIKDATKTAQLLHSKFSLSFCYLDLSNVWLRVASEMHNDPIVTCHVVASAENQVHRVQEACKLIMLCVSIHPLIDTLGRSPGHFPRPRRGVLLIS